MQYIMYGNIVLLSGDKEENTEYIFSFWSNKVDIPGPQRATRPLSLHIAGEHNKAMLYLGEIGRSNEHYYR